MAPKRKGAAAALTARRGGGALALRGGARGSGSGGGGGLGRGEFAQANPLAVQRGKAPPRPPKGPPPGHSRVGFAEYHERLGKKERG